MQDVSGIGTLHASKGIRIIDCGDAFGDCSDEVLPIQLMESCVKYRRRPGSS